MGVEFRYLEAFEGCLSGRDVLRRTPAREGVIEVGVSEVES